MTGTVSQPAVNLELAMESPAVSLDVALEPSSNDDGPDHGSFSTIAPLFAYFTLITCDRCEIDTFPLISVRYTYTV